MMAAKRGLERMRYRASIALLVLSLAAVGGCGDDAGSETEEPTSEGTVISPTEAATPALIGSWHRAQACSEMLAAFDQAGLAESHREWLQGNFYGGEPGPEEGDPCAGADGPLEHDHFFTGDGGFGSHDQNGEEVDGGDFEMVDDDTVSFPSHAAEFGYDGDVVVDYSVDGDVATFEVALPEPCTDTCADAYAWALSAFASGPWSAARCLVAARSHPRWAATRRRPGRSTRRSGTATLTLCYYAGSPGVIRSREQRARSWSERSRQKRQRRSPLGLA